jgi:hypothetical protein
MLFGPYGTFSLLSLHQLTNYYIFFKFYNDSTWHDICPSPANTCKGAYYIMTVSYGPAVSVYYSFFTFIQSTNGIPWLSGM